MTLEASFTIVIFLWDRLREKMEKENKAPKVGKIVNKNTSKNIVGRLTLPGPNVLSLLTSVIYECLL
jgi:hypothetical protein